MIIYMTRKMDEILDSMEKMLGNVNRKEEKPLMEKLNRISINLMKKREDIDYILVNYNQILEYPVPEIERINDFLGHILDVNSAVKAIDPLLYRS